MKNEEKSAICDRYHLESELDDCIEKCFNEGSLVYNSHDWYVDAIHRRQAGVAYNYVYRAFNGLTVNLVRPLNLLCQGKRIEDAEQAFSWFDYYSPVPRFIRSSVEFLYDLGFREAIKPMLKSICRSVGELAVEYDIDPEELTGELSKAKRATEDLENPDPWEHWEEWRELRGKMAQPSSFAEGMGQATIPC